MDNEQAGLVIRGNSIQISFTYMGQRCRETIRVKPTKTAIREVSGKRASIIYLIDMGKFDYADHFPNSKHALRYSKNKGSLILIKDSLNRWLIDCNKRCELSTINGYSKIIQNQLLPEFGDLTFSDITPMLIREWISKQTCSNKRINNILSPLKQVFKEAYCDGTIDSNPLDRIKSLKVTTKEPDPFNKTEIGKILEKLEGSDQNLIQFAFSSGLRTSELIALRWQDVDFLKKCIYVRQAKVRGQIKTTKTSSGLRTVAFQDMAKVALNLQHQLTKEQEFVFIDNKTNLPWRNDQPIRKRVWTPALKKAGIRYRVPYQTRHTFASMLLSRGENPMWVAKQMGHKDWGMLRKVYGRWIEN